MSGGGIYARLSRTIGHPYGANMRKSMKILFGVGLASAGAFAAATPGQAADIYRREPSIKDTPPPTAYLPAITWTGLYIGGNIGAVWPNDDLEIIDNSAQLIGGGHLGYNWQMPSSWVIGVEGDVDFSDEFDYLASVRARLGYAFGRTLVYGTGGVAFAGFSNSFMDNETGWVAGGGVETKVRPNVSLGLEALYYNFDNASTNIGLDNSTDALTVRGRLTFHMNSFAEPLK
jgi:outer membrane immunogenic protein